MQYAVRRRRVKWDNILFAVVVLVVLVFAVNFIAEANDQRAEWESTREVITIYVEGGDTLDGLGYQYKPSWMDIREYREEIKELNGMQSSDLDMGQELKLYK